MFLSKSYFVSRNCIREVRAAVSALKPSTLVHEADAARGGLPLVDSISECPDELRPNVFGRHAEEQSEKRSKYWGDASKKLHLASTSDRVRGLSASTSRSASLSAPLQPDGSSTQSGSLSENDAAAAIARVWRLRKEASADHVMDPSEGRIAHKWRLRKEASTDHVMDPSEGGSAIPEDSSFRGSDAVLSEPHTVRWSRSRSHAAVLTPTQMANPSRRRAVITWCARSEPTLF